MPRGGGFGAMAFTKNCREKRGLSCPNSLDKYGLVKTCRRSENFPILRGPRDSAYVFLTVKLCEEHTYGTEDEGRATTQRRTQREAQGRRRRCGAAPHEPPNARAPRQLLRYAYLAPA